MKVLDLFSGTGGFAMGLEAAGMTAVAFCESEPHAQRVITKHWPDVPLYGDVATLTRKRLDRYGITDIELICGGFPCQDISIAGKNAGIEKGEKSGLWREFKRVIGEVRPKYALIENVSALLSRGLNVILKDLAEIGYDATWTVVDSQFTGIPQRRRRVYILAVRDGIPADADIFRFKERHSKALRQQMEDIEKGRRWNFAKSADIGYRFAFYTRQRSDQLDCLGVASTLLKRDYKDFTDLVLDAHGLRRVTPTERLLLQGYPADFFDGCGLTDTQKFTLNGMSIPSVKWLGECIMEFDLSRVR